MRLRLYAKDIAEIEGLTIRSAQQKIAEIRKACGVAPRQPLFINQYALCMSVPEDSIIRAINR